MGSVGMYHPMDVSPNSLRLTESGTKHNTVERYRSVRAKPHQAMRTATGRTNTYGASSAQPAKARRVMARPASHPARAVVMVFVQEAFWARCNVSQASMAKKAAPTATTDVITTISQRMGLAFLSAALA